MPDIRAHRSAEHSGRMIERAEAKRLRRENRNRRIAMLTGQSEPLINYDLLTVSKLLELAKARGFKVTTKTRKPELVELLSASK